MRDLLYEDSGIAEVRNRKLRFARWNDGEC